MMAQQLKNCLDLSEFVEGGTQFELSDTEPPSNLDKDNKNEKEQYEEAIKAFYKFECLGHDEETENPIEPFQSLSTKMTNLLSNGKIKKRKLRDGYGATPITANTVKINYNAYTEYEAAPFDSTYARNKPFYFTVGEGNVLEGLEIAVQSMQLTEKSEFLIDSKYAYKDSGLNRIQPNSTILFEIELMEIMNTKPPEDDDKTVTFDDIYKYCQALCTKGKNLFIKQDFTSAVKEYKCAVKKLEKAILRNEDDEQKSQELLIRLYTNLLVCYTHLGVPKKGCLNANEIFRLKNNKGVSAKVYFNNAKCLRMLGDFKAALKRLNIAQKMNPNSPEIAQERLIIEKALDDNKNRDKALGKALLNN